MRMLIEEKQFHNALAFLRMNTIYIFIMYPSTFEISSGSCAELPLVEVKLMFSD